MNGGWKADYHIHSTLQFEVAKKALSSFNLRGDERILDVGCGTGRTTNFYAHQLPSGSIVGIDLSSDMIDFAKKEFKDTKNLTFKVCDVTELPFDQEFDIAYSFYCLHWVHDCQKAFESIARSLKPGGRAILYISFETESYRVWNKCVREVADENPAWEPFIMNKLRLEPLDSWLDYAQNAGFKIIKHLIFERINVFPTITEFKNHVKVLDVAELNDEEKSRFVDKVLKKIYAAYNKKTDEPFYFKPSTLVLHLLKE